MKTKVCLEGLQLKAQVLYLNPHVSLGRAAHVAGGASVCAGADHEQIQRAGVSPSDDQQER